jgi:hypothetical protein
VSFAWVVQDPKDGGFGVRIADGGMTAHLGVRRTSRQELFGVVSDLEGLLMKTVGGGVFIRVGERILSRNGSCPHSRFELSS